ncbi:MAG TPA: CAP domain-containing protein [Actinomycetota bacterium]|nr:CAP domain-containing protein [Actinomycetota bacterium]
MSHRKITISLLVVVVLVTGTSSSEVRAAEPSKRVRMIRLLNQSRRNHGLPVFRLNYKLSSFAWQHSKRMAGRNRLFHTANLYEAVRTWTPSTWGENVGVAGTLRRVRRLWMHSWGHRDNILNPRFRRVGIGVVKARGLLWVTTIFYGR